MFVDQLIEEEKKALMALLIDISKADGNLAEQEIEFLSAYSAENGIALNLDQDISLPNACGLIESNKGKIVAIQEIVKLAIVDGHYDEAERKGALAIAEMLGIPLAKFQEVEKWVLDGQQWVSQGVQMINEA